MLLTRRVRRNKRSASANAGWSRCACLSWDWLSSWAHSSSTRNWKNWPSNKWSSAHRTKACGHISLETPRLRSTGTGHFSTSPTLTICFSTMRNHALESSKATRSLSNRTTWISHISKMEIEYRWWTGYISSIIQKLAISTKRSRCSMSVV